MRQIAKLNTDGQPEYPIALAIDGKHKSTTDKVYRNFASRDYLQYFTLQGARELKAQLELAIGEVENSIYHCPHCGR